MSQIFQLFRCSVLPVVLSWLSFLMLACSDPSYEATSANEAVSNQRVASNEVFPFSHNPARLAKIGPDACVKCHEQEVEDWKSSHHAKANRPVSVLRDSPAFTPTRRIQESGVTYEMVQVGDAFKMRVIAEDGTVEAYDLVGVIGETPLRQYLAHMPGNRFQTATATYDVLGDRWVDVFAGENRQPREWGHWTGQGMNWNANCAYCHTTEYDKGFDFESNTYSSNWIQQGLACAECHNGLETHVEAAVDGDYSSGLSQLDREQNEDNCVSCHARRDQLTPDAFEVGDLYEDHFALSLPDQPGLYFPDGQILEEVFVHGSFEMSRMGHAGVSCMDCHNPHTLESILPVENNMLCMRCHETGIMEAPVIEPVKHSFHAEGSTGNRCVECHMPQRVYMQVDPRADHGFHSPDPLMTKELGIPNACSSCHTDQSIDWAVKYAEAWYGDKLAESRQRQRARTISRAYEYDPSALPELFELAGTEDIPAWQATYAGLMGNYLPNPEVETYLRGLLEDSSPMVRASAIRGLARVAESGEVLLERLSDPVRSVRIDVARAMAMRNEPMPQGAAAEDWEAYQAFNSDRPQTLIIEANEAAREGRGADVVQYVDRAISLDSGNAEMYYQASILLSTAGLNTDARTQLFKGWELAPDDSRFPFSLGLVLAEMGDLQSAVGYFEEAVAVNSEDYRAWYNLSLAYSKLNQPEAAARAMRKARGQ